MENKKCFIKFSIGSLILVLLLCILPVAALAGTIYYGEDYDPITGELISRMQAVTTVTESGPVFGDWSIVESCDNTDVDGPKSQTWVYSEKDEWSLEKGANIDLKWFKGELSKSYGSEKEYSYENESIIPKHSRMHLLVARVTVTKKLTTVITHLVRSSANDEWQPCDMCNPYTSYTTEIHTYPAFTTDTELLSHEKKLVKPVAEEQPDGTMAYPCRFAGCKAVIPAVGPHTCSFAGATCTSRGRCTICKKYCNALGHSWTVTSNTNPGCEIGGKTVQKCIRCSQTKTTTGSAPLGHKYAKATCTSGPKCSRCGNIDGDPLGHSWSVISNTNAGCNVGGKTVRKCTRCSQTKTTTSAKLEHSWGSWTTIVYPTSTMPGQRRHTCTRCGTTETKSYR